MSPWTTLVVLCSAVSYVIAGPVQCRINDIGCIKNIFANSFTKILRGNPELGVENLDPMHHNKINGNLPTLKYKMSDSTVTGFKDCKIEDVRFNIESLTAKIVMLCPKFTMTGKYYIHGQLMVLPVEGNGAFTILTKKYKLTIDAKIKMQPGKDGKTYASVKGFKLTAEPLEDVKFDFKNLFNGQNDLAEPVLKYANENWYKVAKALQGPIFKASVKKLIKNINSFYKKQAIEDLLKIKKRKINLMDQREYIFLVLSQFVASVLFIQIEKI